MDDELLDGFAPPRHGEPLRPLSDDETTLAMLAYLLSAFGGGFIAPLVIFFVRRESPFVRFHAAQALIHSAVLACISIGLVGAMLARMIFEVTTKLRPGAPRHSEPPWLFFAMFPVIWGAVIVSTLLSVIFAVLAKQGRWSGLPGVRLLARSMMYSG